MFFTIQMAINNEFMWGWRLLNEDQKQAIDGAMLGDGHLSCRYKNAELRYVSSIENHVKLIKNYFINYII